MFMYVRIYIHTYIHIYMYVCICVGVCACARLWCVRVRTYVCMYVCIHLNHLKVHTQTPHTHTQAYGHCDSWKMHRSWRRAQELRARNSEEQIRVVTDRRRICRLSFRQWFCVVSLSHSLHKCILTGNTIK